MIETVIENLPTWVENDSYLAQCDMRRRAAEKAGQYMDAMIQLLFAMSGARWIEKSGNKPDLGTFHKGVVKQAFWACQINGGFASVSESTIITLYDHLIGESWIDFVAENQQQLINSEWAGQPPS